MRKWDKMRKRDKMKKWDKMGKWDKIRQWNRMRTWDSVRKWDDEKVDKMRKWYMKEDAIHVVGEHIPLTYKMCISCMQQEHHEVKQIKLMRSCYLGMKWEKNTPKQLPPALIDSIVCWVRLMEGEMWVNRSCKPHRLKMRLRALTSTHGGELTTTAKTETQQQQCGRQEESGSGQIIDLIDGRRHSGGDVGGRHGGQLRQPHGQELVNA